MGYVLQKPRWFNGNPIKYIYARTLGYKRTQGVIWRWVMWHSHLEKFDIHQVNQSVFEEPSLPHATTGTKRRDFGFLHLEETVNESKEVTSITRRKIGLVCCLQQCWTKYLYDGSSDLPRHGHKSNMTDRPGAWTRTTTRASRRNTAKPARLLNHPL